MKVRLNQAGLFLFQDISFLCLYIVQKVVFFRLKYVVGMNFVVYLSYC